MARKKDPDLHGYLIYGLIDPETKELRYVGKSSSGLVRPRSHSYPSNKHKTASANWSRSLLSKNLTPEIIVLERCDSLECTVECEQFWIAYFKFLGCRLLNLTIGGEGTIGYRFSEESKAKMSASHTGRRLSEEHKEKLRQIGKRSDNVEHCKALAQKLKGAKYPRDSVERGAAKRRGKTLSKDVCLKFSRSHGGKPIVDQYGNVYSYMKEAANAIGVSNSTIWKALKGKRKSAKGYVFRYLDEVQS